MNVYADLVLSIPVVVSFLIGVSGVGRVKGMSVVVCLSLLAYGYCAFSGLVRDALAGWQHGSGTRAVVMVGCGLGLSLAAFLCGQQSR
jgi:hypothetical protein